MAGNLRERIHEIFDRIPGGGIGLSVWLCAASVAAFLFSLRTTQIEYVGFARTLDYEVSAPEAAVVSDVLVDLYETVAAGERIAIFDDRVVVAEIEAARAEVQALENDLDLAIAGLTRGITAERLDAYEHLRRFALDEEDRALEELRLRIALATDRVEEQRLRLRRERIEALARDGVVSKEEHDNARLEHETVVRRISESEVALARVLEELHAARERRARYVAQIESAEDAPDAFLRPLHARIEAQRHRVEGIEARRSALVLRAPVAGRIRALFAQAGQTVLAGEPVAILAPETATEVIAYVPEAARRDIESYASVTVRAVRNPQRIAAAVVVEISPAIELMPERFWQSPRIPEYGRAFRAVVAPGVGLVPGERVRVRFEDS